MLRVSFVVLTLLFGYLLGSIPFGAIAGWAGGIKVQRHGSGNIGATNVLRVLGKKFGYAVFVADTAKGFLAVVGAAYFFRRFGASPEQVELVALFAGVACILGHAFPIWLNFQGGKGVATSAGAVLGLMPVAAMSAALLWIVVFKTTRYVSIASIVAALAVPAIVIAYLLIHHRTPAGMLGFSTTMASVLVWRHRSNIHRLLNGTEPRFARK
jgi:glycerol-3-phosphate acyltransferase PlsY